MRGRRRWLLWAAPSVVVLGGLTGLVLWGLAQIPEESKYPGSCSYWNEEDYARLDRLPLADLVGDPTIATSSAMCWGDSWYGLTRSVEVGQPLSVPSTGTVIGEWQVVRSSDAGEFATADGEVACLTSEREEWSDIRVVIRPDQAWADIFRRGQPDPCGIDATASTVR